MFRKHNRLVSRILNVVEGGGLLDESAKINAHTAELDNLAYNYSEQEKKQRKLKKIQEHLQEENLLLVKENEKRLKA